MKSNSKIIPFYSKRWIYFTISISIMIIGTLFAIFRGVELDIQFKGGALLKYNYEGSIDENAVADFVSEQLNRNVSPSLTENYSTGKTQIIFNLAGKYGLDAKDQQELDNALIKKYPENKLDLEETQMVERFFGDKFFKSGIQAVLIAAALIVLYVWIRFKMISGLSAGVMALVALVHDVFVVFFTCVIFGIPIGESFIAVALSILGYSINDTIVIYDRIRENSKIYIGETIEKITDLSITQSMMRSVNTNIAVMISVSLVYIIANYNNIDSITAFALPMAVGSISGCYSTICIAGPLWVSWKKKKGEGIIKDDKKPVQNKKYYQYK